MFKLQGTAARHVLELRVQSIEGSGHAGKEKQQGEGPASHGSLATLYDNRFRERHVARARRFVGVFRMFYLLADERFGFCFYAHDVRPRSRDRESERT